MATEPAQRGQYPSAIEAQIILFWGPEFVCIYNDAYRPIFGIGARHPSALGKAGADAWDVIWPVLGPLLKGVVTTGEAFSAPDFPYFVDRGGFLEEVYFDVSYDPVRDETGGVGGVFCIVSETTQRVLGERRLRTTPAEVSIQRRDEQTLTGIKVLVVDDDSDARDVLRRILVQHGAEVCVAKSAREGYSTLGTFAPDVLVSDIGMPDEDGYQFIKGLRSRGVSAPALALTAYARTDDRLRALASGYQNHVAKPVEPVELVRTVAALVKRRSATPS